mgnify:CR=1 FL=1
MQAEVALAGFNFALYWGCIIAMTGYAVGKAIQLLSNLILKGGD